MTVGRQFLIFALVGVAGTSGHYLTLIALVQWVALTPVVATSFGFGVGAVINYLLNYRFTFHSRQQHRKALPKFLLVAAAGALVNGAVMALGHTQLGLHYLLAQVIATVLVLLWNFAINKIWTFAE
ncbi:MAG: GtrA family protein [Gammaproteobacteria bacterium]|nr:GtrA family protein [Gammaproteobacteria bacterium]